MKLIAARPIFNSKNLGVTVDKNDKLFRHTNEIHTGARFSIGTGESFKDLDAVAKENVGCLVSRRLAVLDNSDNASSGVIARIDEQAAEEFAAFKAAQKKPASLFDMIAALLKSNQDLIAATKSAPAK